MSKVVLMSRKYSLFFFRPNPSVASAWYTKTTISIELIFQRWISWFPQRWRTPRNAICNVNCRIKWIIKSLNANCCSDYCSWSMPGSDSVNHHNPHLNWGKDGACDSFMRLEKKQLSIDACRLKPIKVFSEICVWWVVSEITNCLELSSGKETRWI